MLKATLHVTDAIKFKVIMRFHYALKHFFSFLALLRRRLIKNQITQKIRFVPRAFTTGQEFRSGHRAFKWGRGGDYIFFELVDKNKVANKSGHFPFSA